MVVDPESDSRFGRRAFLARAGMGMGLLGLAPLLRQSVDANVGGHSSLAPREPHFPVKARHVVQVFAQGAPSQMDTWDPKPELARLHGQPLPGKRGKAFGSPFNFETHGQSGIPVSEVFPQLAAHVDDLAVIRSVHTDIPGHTVAKWMMNTGSSSLPKPSLGSWVVYGLGTLNQNLPGFISLRPERSAGAKNYQSAFLPGAFQGTSINASAKSASEMLRNIRNPYLSGEAQRRQLDLVGLYNSLHSRRLNKEPRLEAQIASYEMAFRMQAEATDAFDLDQETAKVRERYGNTSQGRKLLLTRRLIERGVRFVQVWAGLWDHHANLETDLREVGNAADRALAAFLTDLKERGLFDETLVVWGGEFGRTPGGEGGGGAAPGRNHNNRAFSYWLAGGGVKGGTIHGATDEFGQRAVEKKVSVPDLHATILALMGFDHTRLTYRHNGRDFRLTDNKGEVVKEVIA